ncbi:MAG: hypothetical protein ACOH2H_23450 [Cypionkella sp.]
MVRITPDCAIPVAALITEAQRELDLRRQFYWARVRAGKMRQADADKRIALMAAIVKRLTVTVAL